MKHSSSMQPATKKGGSRGRLAMSVALVGALLGALVLSLAACRGEPGDSNAKSAPSSTAPTAPRDAYDLAEMDFKTPPAVLSTVRYTGPFAAGDALGSSSGAIVEFMIPEAGSYVMVAATYDHGVVERAAANGDVVVYCEVTGPLDAPRLKEATRRVPGVKRQSVRVSAQPAALSFAFDPKLQSPQTAVHAAQRCISPSTRLTIVRVLAAEPRARL